MTEQTADYDQAPLLSPRFVWKLTAGVAVLCLLTLAISIGGRMFGRTVLLAGHTAETHPVHIRIGANDITLPANVIRFQAERRDGPRDAVDTYFAWPGMRGYSPRTRPIFDQTDPSSRDRGLLFASLAQSTMSRDMSGRYRPIYSRLIEGPAAAGPGGLVSYRLRATTGYSNELLYVDPAGGDTPYVVRCLVAAPNEPTLDTMTGCQRDVFIGTGLTMTYRFSINLLAHWRQIEIDLRNRMQTALSPSN
ncbi:hypothetical protein [Pseudohoeflea coraliihabitans]|uniref:Transmembrane anchored protein n=1 Tax=Pseudohoeflea coraliihabitans TaxID=2860393 RepID=A0ABS6WQF9_9HYPH|nr:hypothetical protein [Pseudohoeflea sp. DP4N28-3]MBW3098206.1 hypothetical protein [Pseudohoeflea sp. DP4N28-3]